MQLGAFQFTLRSNLALFALAVAVALGGCDVATASDCGPGTALVDGKCVPSGDGICEPGTVFKDGACIGAPTASDATDAGSEMDGASGVDTAGASDASAGSDGAAGTDDAAVDAGATPDTAEDTAGGSDAAACTPQCAGKKCGPDGCDGICGACAGANEVCTPTGQCEACTPACAGKSCGPDGCGGQCGTCSAPGDLCSAAGKCEACTPQCSGKSCGPDGCGGSCGSCLLVDGKPYCDGSQCVAACQPNCTDSECGPDGCGGVCGSCGVGNYCELQQCVALDAKASCKNLCGKTAESGCSCEPNCKGPSCCLDFQVACPCVPQCNGKTCGADGCGGVCGSCGAGKQCVEGNCQADPCAPDPCGGNGSCQAGTCTCKLGFTGKKCDSCAAGYVGFPNCAPDPCAGQTCNGQGTCDPVTGACKCKPGFVGSTCGNCKFAIQAWPACGPNACDGVVCAKGSCLSDSGECQCQAGFAGEKCDACASAKETFPNCSAPTTTLLSSPNLASLTCSFCSTSLDKYPKEVDTTDTLPPSVLVTMPISGAVVAPGSPLILVLDDVLDTTTVTTTTLKLTPKSAPSLNVTGVAGMQATPSGQSLLMFFPVGVLASGSYVLTAEGIKDNGGNVLPKVQLEVIIDGASAGVNFGNNLGFDSPSVGCYFAGDAASGVGASDNVTPYKDQGAMLGLSSGEGKFGGKALNGYGSFAICGPVLIPPGMSHLQFQYRFASEEFDEYVGQQFDDFALASVSGLGGGAGGVLTSVNAIGAGQTPTKAFGSGTEGDQICKVSQWQTATVGNIGTLGSYVVLTFAVTDVADTQMNSMLLIDNVVFTKPAQ